MLLVAGAELAYANGHWMVTALCTAVVVLQTMAALLPWMESICDDF
jgi:hypothetical protein